MTPIAFLIVWIARSAILILLGALLLRLLRVTNPSLRLTAWTALLLGSLAIPLLTTALPELPIRLLPQDPPATIVAPALHFTNPSETPALNINIAPAPPHPAPAKPIDWMQLVLICYAAIATALLARLLVGLWLSRGILHRSSPTGLAANRGTIRESHEVESPVTAGIIRSVILLPKDWRAWDTTRLNAVLAHESSHVRRRDPAVQFLSSLHCALLWISPATWLLHRAIVRTAEEISDEDAIAATPDRTTYVEILLDFIQRGARANPVEVAMARYDQPKTRIRRILNATAGAHRATRAGIVSTLAVIVPLSCLAAVVYPKHSSPQPSASIRIEPPPGLPAAAPLELAQVTAPPLPSPPPALELPQFEAATVKPGEHGVTGFKVFPGGRLLARNQSLKSLIYAAFEVPWSRIQGGEEWTASEEYSIEAKPSESIRIGSLRYSNFTIQDATLRKMLQALLIDRFHLKFHVETRTGDVLLLERNNKELRFAPPTARLTEEAQRMYPTNFSSIGYVDGKWSLFQTSMAQLAAFAGDIIFHVPVMDRTGISGPFEYRQPAQDLDPKYSGDQSISFTDFLQNAGLKLERAKGPVEYFVIDGAERPSNN